MDATSASMQVGSRKREVITLYTILHSKTKTNIYIKNTKQIYIALLCWALTTLTQV